MSHLSRSQRREVRETQSCVEIYIGPNPLRHAHLWLKPSEMLDGLGMAETFVDLLAAVGELRALVLARGRRAGFRVIR